MDYPNDDASGKKGSTRLLRLPGALFLLILIFTLTGVASAQTATTGGVTFYEREIRPLLTNRCYACHSEQSKPPQGGLRLDNRTAWMRGGASGPAVQPNDPDHSLLLQAVRYTGKLRMPPGGKLPDAEIAVLTAWIKKGAPGPKETGTPKPEANASHWAFQPLRKAALPKVRNEAWCRTPIDRFVLAQLEKAGMQPSRPADKRTLLRRVTYDLIGLPPTPQEMTDFLADNSPTAYEKVVDRLLASPRYGERWGRHWLDVVHYGDNPWLR